MHNFAELHVQVVKVEGKILLRQGNSRGSQVAGGDTRRLDLRSGDRGSGGLRRRTLDNEFRNGLRRVVVENLEIFLTQTSHNMARGMLYDDAHQDLITAGLDFEGGFFGRGRGGWEPMGFLLQAGPGAVDPRQVPSAAPAQDMITIGPYSKRAP